MPVYKQIKEWYEDGYGYCTATLVCSDTHEDLLSEEAAIVNIFHIGDGDDSMEDDNGNLVQSEISFKINQASIRTEADQACYDFVKAGINPANKRFFALFIHPSSSAYTIEDIRFSGLITPERDEEDLSHSGGEYSETPNPIQELSQKAEPFFEKLFEEFELKHLIEGNEALDIPGIDETWETANVSDRPGWFERDTRTTQVHQLVDINKILRKLADNLVAAISNNDLGEYTIIFDRCELQGKWFPTRWNPGNLPRGGGIAYPRYPGQFYQLGDSNTPRQNLQDPNLEGYNYAFYPDDGVSIVIDPDGEYTDNETFFYDYKNLKLQSDYELSPSEAQSNLWSSHVKTFTELMYKIASDLKIYVSFYYEDSTTFHVKFENRANYVRDQVYVKGSVKSNRKITFGEEPATKYGEGSYFTSDGFDVYGFIATKEYIVDGQVKFSKEVYKTEKRLKNSSPNGTRALLTISPIVKCVGEATDDGVTRSAFILPHNHYFKNGGVLHRIDEKRSAVSMHTGLYIKVPKRPEDAENPYEFYTENEPDIYWTPVGLYAIEVDGATKKYTSLSTYNNDMIARLKNSIVNLEKEISVPFINGFSENSDGSDPSWKNLKLGSKYVQDEVEYVVKSIKYSIESLTTVIRLTAISTYEAIGAPTEITTEGIHDIGATTGVGITSAKSFYVANSAIGEGNVVSLRSDGKIEKSEATDAHYDRVFGIAINAGSEDDGILVARSGEIITTDIDGLDLGVVYLRSGDDNISNDRLTGKSSTEDLHQKVGRMIDENLLEIDIQQGSVFI